jgi:kynureninase
MRPVITGWFSEFGAIIDSDADSITDGKTGAAGPQSGVPYGKGPSRFAGSTYDPVSHYRAAEVFDFFEEMALDPGFLRRISRHQVGLLAELFDDMDTNPLVIDRDRAVALDDVGGFLALETPHAAAFSSELRLRGVHTDHRGNLLRLGPAPYLSDRQLIDAMGLLSEAIKVLKPTSGSK